MDDKACCDRLTAVIRGYNNYFTNILNHRVDAKRRTIKKEGYPFIASGRAVSILKCLGRIQKHLMANNGVYFPKFVDCGCGIGNVLLLANSMGYEVTGIEHDGKTAKIAEKMMQFTGSSVIKEDIAKFKHYSRFDVIYFYTPINSCALMDQFLKNVRDSAKVGAVIVSYNQAIGILSKSRMFKRMKECKCDGHLGIQVYEKVRKSNSW